MGEDLSDFGSDNWVSYLDSLCQDVYRNLQERLGGQHLVYRRDLIGTKEKPGIIVTEYHNSVNILKHELFENKAKTSLLDYHKIAALYIRSFLIYQPFVLSIAPETKSYKLCLHTILANEYLSVAFLGSIYKTWNKKIGWSLQDMDIKYKFDFIKLLFHYKEDITHLDPLSLSNIIYLIEQHYFKDISQPLTH